MTAKAWMRENLETQGYCLSDREAHELRVALRFSTGTCLVLFAVALALGSPAMVFALAGIGVVASFGARHPFDHVWNRAVRHVVGGPGLPPNPPRRRQAFRVATVWAALVGVLLAVGATVAAIVLGGMLIAACAAVTVANLCLPSEALAWWERRAAAKVSAPAG
jgi:hypothetical protein